MSNQNQAWRLIIVQSLVFFIVFQLSVLILLPIAIICNVGIGFGIRLSAHALIAASITALFFSGILIQKLLREKLNQLLLEIGGGILFGGALSNIANRLMWGCVPDFFHLSWFPAFNMADIGISLGAFLLILSMLKNKERELGIRN